MASSEFIVLIIRTLRSFLGGLSAPRRSIGCTPPQTRSQLMNTVSPSTPIALVTGGNRGLGRDMVLSLARRGVDLIFTYRNNQAEAAGVVAQVEKLGRRAVALQLDVGISATFSKFASQVREELRNRWQRDRFNYLVNNAGIGAHASFAETTEEQFDQLVAVQFKGPFFLTQKLLPLLSDGGRIINISSGLTRFSYPGYAAYASMKGAIEVLTRYQAKELGSRGIAVNAIAPGPTATDFSGGIMQSDQF